MEVFTYTFKNVKQLYVAKGTSLSSPVFLTSNTGDSAIDILNKMHWSLIITVEDRSETGFYENRETYRKKFKVEDKCMALYLQVIDVSLSNTSILKVSFSIMNPIEGETFTKSRLILKATQGEKYGFSDFIAIDQLNKLNIEDLTIHCKIGKAQKDIKSYKPLLNNSMFSDVELRIADQSYPVHKLILSMSSIVFQNKFGAQDSISYVQVNDVEPKLFEKLLRYMYTEEVDNLETLASEIFVAATRYEIRSLQEKCRKILEANLKVENVMSTMFLVPYNEGGVEVNYLTVACRRFIRDNLKTIMNSGVCKDLVHNDPQCLRDILHYMSMRVKKLSCKSVSNLDVSLECGTLCCCKRYETFLNNEVHSDIKIYVRDKIFYAHKLVLSAGSPVFSRIFDHEFKETVSGVVEITDLEPDVFEKVLRFMYTHKLENIENIVREMLTAADKYDINDLKMKCEDILQANLTVENVFSTLLFSDQNNATRLKDKCINFIIEYLVDNEGVSQLKFWVGVCRLSSCLIWAMLNKLANDQVLVFYDR